MNSIHAIYMHSSIYLFMHINTCKYKQTVMKWKFPAFCAQHTIVEKYGLPRKKRKLRFPISHFTFAININKVDSFAPVRNANQDTTEKENGS